MSDISSLFCQIQIALLLYICLRRPASTAKGPLARRTQGQKNPHESFESFSRIRQGPSVQEAILTHQNLGKSQKSNMQHSRALLVFPILAIVSLYYLWVPFLHNGTVGAMENAVQQRKFADGTDLRSVYTGLAPVDHALSTLVVFTYYPTNGNDKETRLLYIEILSALQTGQLWCLVESLRSGRTSIALAM